MGAGYPLTALWPCTTSLFILHIATLTTGSGLLKHASIGSEFALVKSFNTMGTGDKINSSKELCQVGDPWDGLDGWSMYWFRWKTQGGLVHVNDQRNGSAGGPGMVQVGYPWHNSGGWSLECSIWMIPVLVQADDLRTTSSSSAWGDSSWIQPVVQLNLFSFLQGQTHRSILCSK